MKRSLITRSAVLAAATLALTGCSTGGSDTTAGASAVCEDSTEPVTLSLAAWGLSTSTDFQTLTDSFHLENPNITVELAEYDATDYDTQLTADLAAGSAPDLYPIKTITTFPTYQEGGQLLDVSEVTDVLGADYPGIEYYTTDGAAYAVPYRQDAWYLYYNKELFDLAGVSYPDGTWTWDEYDDVAVELTENLEAAGQQNVKGTYLHSWATALQSFATAQAGSDEAYFAADWDYMVPFYERAIALQDAGAQENYGVVTTNSLTYQGQFGTQKTAMMPMGSWYIAALLSQRESGDADVFEWGIAPAPQVDDTTLDHPVTQGNPTAIGINAAIDDAKACAAKDFLTYVSSEPAAVELAGIGLRPSYTADVVTDTVFSQEGMPTDPESRVAFSTLEAHPDAPLGSDTPALQNILKDAHSAILSGAVSPEDGIAQAMERARSEGLG
ncbi:ABC transporter substrate-binding protein [Sanguibacter antarcticus]|uniref:Carbohydrate ABC transporter substrate-binding protein (CUT1 family) n=1 Tax=Sanguibacter antarcticus TaxID=372484 RepID=A0A2A9E6H8_9MICO|nr:extracellular solute-binding protein [Sanguibacter antarcticus]PFG34434.1 carbohydrate ABC transporter substrate-binding protein (CUT1 family) [Sanguibacter antarcticus]